MKIALSMTSIPRRFEFLTKECFPAIEQSIIKIKTRLFYDFGINLTEFVLTLDDNLTDEELNQYKNWADNLIASCLNVVIRQDNHEYRCINKEIGGWKYCKEHGFDAFITLDDDQMYNDAEKFYDLCKYFYHNQKDVICVETNPVAMRQDGNIDIICGLPPKIAALRSHSKILSNFCLFPANCFDGTRIDDLEYIRAQEWNRHDELFAWAELTRKGLTSIVLPNTYSLAWDNFNTDFTGDEKGLRDYNSEHWNDWTAKINEQYPEFKRIFENEVWEYFVEDKNAFAIAILRQNGWMNGMAANMRKIVTVNTSMITSNSYKKFMYRQ